MQTYAERLDILDPPGAFVGILIAILFLLLLYISLNSSKGIKSLTRRYLLTLLHIFSFILITFLLCNPVLRVESFREEKPNLAVLVDSSWSMNLPGNKKDISRFQEVKDYLKKHKQFFADIEKDFNVNYFTFDKSLKRSSLDSIYSLSPDGNNTDIIESVHELLGEQQNDNINTVILFSDGASGKELNKAGEELLRDSVFKINTVYTASLSEIPDVWIESVKSSEVGFLRYPVSVDVGIKSIGYKKSSLPVILKDGDKIISVKEVSFNDANGEGKVNFMITPKSLGRRIYTVTIPIVENELIEENNQRSIALDVIINRIRVLHVAGSPSWDVRFLRKALTRNPNVDLVSFFILREATDLVFASQNELSLIPFPTNEILEKELDSFDVVIFQNFDSRPYGINNSQLEELKNFVEEKGGAFLMIGGEDSFNGGDYRRTPIADILPVNLGMDSRVINQSFSERRFKAIINSDGINHPIMRFFSNDYEKLHNWLKMPELEGLNMVDGIKSDSIQLLETTEGEPVFVIARMKNGKVASVFTDSTWKWNIIRSGEGEISPFYDKFLGRLLSWLIDDPDLNDINIVTEKIIYNPSDEPKIDVLVSSIENQELKSSLIFPSGKEVELDFDQTSKGKFTADAIVDEIGVYKVRVSIDNENAIGRIDDSGETAFVVEPPFSEVSGPTTDFSTLKSLAEMTGGNFITLNDGPERFKVDSTPVRTVNGYKTISIWDSPLFFLLLVLLLSSEWILRRRSGLR